MPLNALLGIDQFIKAKYLLKKINVYNVEMNGVVKPLMLTLHWIFRIDQNLTTLKLKKILSLIVYTSLSERNNMRFSSSIFKKIKDQLIVMLCMHILLIYLKIEENCKDKR